MSTAIPSTGALIYISIKPLIRILIPGGIGFLLTKKGIFPASGSRIVSLLIINCTLPALLFSKIVPSFSPANISSLSSLLLTGFFYQGVNFTQGVLVRAFTQTPIQFRYGLLSAFTYSNWGDLPTAVSQAITSSAPFNGTDDENLAIAYVAIFILVAYVTQFPLQGIRMVKMDYDNPVNPEVERQYEEAGGWRKMANRLRRGKPMAWEYAEYAAKRAGKEVVEVEGEKEKSLKEGSVKPGSIHGSIGAVAEGSGTQKDGSPKISLSDINAEIAEIRDFNNNRLQSTVSRTAPPGQPFPCASPTPSLAPTSRSSHPRAAVRVAHSMWKFFATMISPPTVALVTALIIAVVPDIKVLFVASTDGTFHPLAPDGQPPLEILYATAQFVGAASVPLGLIVLGSSLAKMVIPRPVSRLPIASILWMAILRIVALPIMGFFFVKALVRYTKLVSEDNKVLQFVLVYMSCVPTGTIQIAYSQMFAPEGARNNADLLAAYLIAQYVVFIFSSVILTALTLNSIF
ncbi:hypothetical protein T439DRAFT_209834 [Meredithblackwellia eburnea MCA 4105]